jgi:hypothetical protein
MSLYMHVHQPVKVEGDSKQEASQKCDKCDIRLQQPKEGGLLNAAAAAAGQGAKEAAAAVVT